MEILRDNDTGDYFCFIAETCQFHRLDAANYIDAECEAVARFGHDPVEIALENDDA